MSGNPASNTRDCFRELVGKRIVGVLFDACPINRLDIAAGTKTLILEDGRGLTISTLGTFWIESAETVARAVEAKQRELQSVKADLEEALVLSGYPNVERRSTRSKQKRLEQQS